MIQPRKSVQNIEEYETPLFEESYDLKIDANENLFGCSDKVLEAIQNISREQILKYPLYGKITEKIADYLHISPDCIKVTNGADEALFSLMLTYLEKDDVMLTVTPSFSMPKIYAKVVGGNVEEVPYKERWVFPSEEFFSEIKNNPDIKIVHLTSPNNPTGECLSEDLVEKILEIAKDKLVILDETYGSYCKSSFVNKVSEYENLVIVKSCSKDFALAGLRIGYIVTNAERIKTLKKVISPYSVNAVAAIAAEAALSDLKHLEKIKNEVKKSKEILMKGLENLGFTVFPSDANFVLTDVFEKKDYVYNLLISNGIKVRKFSDEKMKTCLRITAPQAENAQKLIEILQPKDTLIFDMDGVLVDVSSSYRTTVQKTFEYFAKEQITLDEISAAKNLGGLNNDWDLTEYLLNQKGISVDRKKLVDVFEKIYFDEGRGLISNEKFLFDKSLISQLFGRYNLCIFTGRPRKEAEFTLEKESIRKYFGEIITMDDLPSDKQKPDTLGIQKILSKILTKKVFYFGDTKDDMICGKNAGVFPIGVLPPQDKSAALKEQLLKNGAVSVLYDINDLVKTVESI